MIFRRTSSKLEKLLRQEIIYSVMKKMTRALTERRENTKVRDYFFSTCEDLQAGTEQGCRGQWSV